MKKVMALIAAFLAVCAAAAQASNDPVRPDGSIRDVPLSNREPNYFLCDGPIKDTVFADDAGLKVQYVAARPDIEVVTYKTLRVGLEARRAAEPSNITVFCGSGRFQIRAIPGDIDSQTIHFEGSASGPRGALFSADSFEKKLKKAVLYVMSGKLPAFAKTVERQDDVRLYKDLKVRRIRDVQYAGEGITVAVFVLTNVSSGPLELGEKQFVRPELADAPLGVVVDPLLLQPGESGTLYIVESGDD